MTTFTLLKAFVCTVIVTPSDDTLKSVQEQYGADHVINYLTASDWGKEAVKITNGAGVDVVIDNSGAGNIEQSLETIRMNGMITVIAFLS